MRSSRIMLPPPSHWRRCACPSHRFSHKFVLHPQSCRPAQPICPFHNVSTLSPCFHPFDNCTQNTIKYLLFERAACVDPGEDALTYCLPHHKAFGRCTARLSGRAGGLSWTVQKQHRSSAEWGLLMLLKWYMITHCSSLEDPVAGDPVI
jgi:hypothetical protein